MFTRIRNLRIGARLGLSFSIVILLLVALSALTWAELSNVRQTAVEVSKEQARRLQLAQEWRQAIAVNAQRALAMGLSADLSLVHHLEADMKMQSARVSDVQKEFSELEVTAEGKALQETIASVRKGYLAQREMMMKARLDGDVERAAALAQDFKPLVSNYVAAATALVDHEVARNEAMSGIMVASMDRMRNATLVACGAAVLVAALLGWLLTRGIVRPLSQAQCTADRIAGGDLTTELCTSSLDEVGDLARSLAKMQDSLRSLVGDIRMSVDNIGVASSEVATGNQDLSARTEQAAASLQQTASSIEEISSTVRHSADNARTADQLARMASDTAMQGGKDVMGVVQTMDEIAASSKRIADIIGVIDGIAFQTNILALNAAVEAARAGTHGRGFAVVAQEVRSLAQRSATAAKEIKTLIVASVEKVEAGTLQVQQAGRTMEDIVSGVQRVSDVVGEISSAAAEQAQGIDEVNKAVSQLDQVTQQNAALVEQSAAAADSLREQAMALSGSVQQFRLAA